MQMRAWVAGVATLFLAVHAFGQAREDDGRSLMATAETSYRRGLADEIWEATMRIDPIDARTQGIVAGGRAYTIRQTMRYGPTSAEDKVLLLYTSPERDAGTWFLSVGHADGPDEQHFKQKDARRARRVDVTELDDLFFRTTFSHRDLKPEELDAYDYHVVRTEVLDGRPCTVVEALPRVAPTTKGYGRREIWVHEIAEGVLVYLEIRYYDVRGTFWKVQRNSGFTAVDPEHHAGIFRPASTTMEDRKINHRTTLEYNAAARRLNPGVEEATFDPRKLAEQR